MNSTTQILIGAAAAVALLFFIFQPGGQPKTTLHWSFDEGSGDSITTEASRELTGILHGPTWTEGVQSSALKFDGEDDYLEVPDSKELDIAGQLTIAAWVNPNEIQTGRQVLVQKKAIGVSDIYSNYTLYAQWTTDRLAFITGDGKRRVGVLSDRGLGTPNKWHHVAVTFNGRKGQVKFYIDGEPAGTDTLTLKPYTNDGPLIIGRYTNKTSQFHLNGMMDELYIYNQSLSKEEIEKLTQVKTPTEPKEG